MTMVMGINPGIFLLLVGLVCSVIWLLRYDGRLGSARKPNRAKLSLVATNTDNAVMITSPAGKIEWVNDAFSRISGYSLAEVAGKMPGAVLPCQLNAAKIMQQIGSGMATKRNFTVEMDCTHKKGHRYWLSLTFSPILAGQKRFVNFICVGADVTARKRAEEEVGRVNRRNELLLNAAGEGIFGLDLQGRITFVNAAAGRLTGWEPSELIGKPASAVLHQLRLTQLPDAGEDHFLTAAFKDGQVKIGDTDHFRRKDATSFSVEYTITPIREGNNLFGAVVIFRDASGQRQSEQIRVRQGRSFALRADIGFALATGDTLKNILQRCCQTLIKHLDGAFARIWTLNAEEDVLELQVSAGMYTHTDGHHGHIPVGTHKVGLIAKERVPQMTNDLATDPGVSDREWVKKEKMTGFVGYPLFVEGRLIGVMAMFSKNRLPNDTFELVSAVADSIAQGIVRKRTEERVVETAALLDKSPEAIIVIDLSHRCTHWNKSAERLYGWSAKEAAGKRADQLMYRDAAYFDRAKKEVLEKGEWKGECCQVNKGDEPIVVESQWTLVQDDAGNPKSFLIVNTDLREKKKIEAQMLRTQRMESIGTLAGGIAHDLNNVLAPILMSVEILKEKFRDDQSRRMLSILESSAKRGADMVKQVLTFARGVDGERVLLQPRHLIREIAKIVSETFPKTIQLKTQLPENLWTTMGDATQLHQVLVNLAVNGRDAMPDGGTLSIIAENTVIEPSQTDNPASAKPGFYVVIKVSDTGTGIPRDVLDKIFEPFFTTKEMGKGTGLGLATVLGIVKSHDGFVQVQTEVNKGTTFLIYLPAMEDSPQPPTDGERPRLPLGRGQLILAVDDEESVLSMTKETLETYGYRVLTARDGTEAVATYSEHRHEIHGVLTDMLMPFMDGPATIRVLRKLDPSVKIIAASGLMDSEKVKDSTGMDDINFLMKPYTAEKLLNTVYKVIGDTNGKAA